MSKPVTYAIRYTGPGSDESNWSYVTPMELGDIKNRTGYGYCCACKETLQFASREAAEKYCKEKEIPLTIFKGSPTHTIVDSVSAKREKDSRTAPPAAKPKSALTGRVMKA